MNDQIRVSLRMRPLNSDESNVESKHAFIKIQDESTVAFN